VDQVSDRRVAVVTGASGRLGTELARRLGAEFEVVAVRNRSGLEVDSQQQVFFDPLGPGSGPLLPAVYEVTADVTDPGDRARLCEVAVARGPVEVLVNAAGASGPGRLLSARAPEADNAVFAVNAFAPVQLARQMAEVAWAPGARSVPSAPCVVNCSAAASLDVDAERDSPVFAASKAALNVFSGHLAAEMAPLGVRVNCVLPAPFPAVVPLERVADAVMELIASTESGRMLAIWPDGDEYL
jgi:NAD(P)-dependent dehydrogenase (short-subunit alcohol dehydrogenase family)